MPEDKTFYVPDEVYSHFKGIVECGQEAEDLWNEKVEEYKIKYPKEYALFESVMNYNFNHDWLNFKLSSVR
jgi:Transketolase